MTRSLTIATLLACGMAIPAAAQDLCGLAPGGNWMGGSPEASDVATADAALDQVALVMAGQSHVSYFSASAAADIRLEAQQQGTGDPVIELLDAAGGFVGGDDDGGGNLSSRLEVTVQPGDYCLVTRGFGDGGLNATIRVATQAMEPLTAGFTDAAAPGAGCDSAPMLAMDGSMTESQVGAPAYRFELTAPQAVAITAENEDADPVIAVLDPDGFEIAYNDDFDGLNSRIDITQPLDPGTYCVTVDSLSDETAPITVSLMGFDAEEAQRLAYARGDQVPPMDGSHPITAAGQIDTRSRLDVTPTPAEVTWVSLDIAESGLLMIEAIAASEGDPLLELYDDLGRQVARDDDGGEGLDSRLTAMVMPGTYLLSVDDLRDTGTLQRLVLQRFVPAE